MAAEPPASSNAPPPRWRGDGPASAGGRQPSTGARGRKVFALIAVMLALGGAAAAWVLFVRPLPAPYFLTLPIREYASRQWPTSPWVVQDGQALLRHFAGGRDAYNSQTRDQLLKELDGLRSRADTPVVVHLRALAVSRPDGVYLLPGDADPDLADTWLPLRDVLKRLRGCPSQHKLLILDVSHSLADPALGVLLDDVAGPVEEAVKQEDDPALLVLCACSAGQVSLACDDARLSILAYYLDQGLSGKADLDGDGRVTVRELAEFVRPRVDRWARENRGRRQTPVLLGAGADFALVAVEAAEAPPAEEPPPLDYPRWLLAGWERRDAWWRDRTYQAAPRVFRQLEATLLRCEQRWQGGIEEQRPQEELARDLALFEEQIKQTRQTTPLPARSLARLALSEKDRTAAAAAVRDLLAPLRSGTPLKPEEKAKAQGGFLEKVKGLPFATVAHAAFESLAETPAPTLAKVQLVQEALQALPGQTLYVETLLLQRRLKDLQERIEDHKPDWTWPVAQVRQALETARQAELVMAALSRSPHALPWVAGRLLGADKQRRDGDKRLFDGWPRDWEEAHAKLRAAELEYGAMSGWIATLDQARQDYDEALAVLPGYAPYLVGRQAPDPGEDRAWEQAVWATGQLADAWTRPGPETFAAIEDLRISLRGQLDALKQSFAAQRKRLEQLEEGEGRDYREWRHVLASPRLTAGQREQCWQAARKLGRRLHQKTQTADREATSGGTRLTDSGPPPDESGTEQDRAARRARFAIDLLRLAGLDGVDKLQIELKQATGKPGSQAWYALGEKLRNAWARQLPAQFRAAESRLAAADQLSRMLLPFDAGGETAPPEHWSRNPALHLQRGQTAKLREWFGERYRTESQLLANHPAYAAFYAEAADECLR